MLRLTLRAHKRWGPRKLRVWFARPTSSLPRAFGQHAAVADDVGAVADAKRLAHIVVGDEHADAARAQEADDALDLDIVNDGKESGSDILVATPGRMFDLISQGHLDVSGIKYLVLDFKSFNIVGGANFNDRKIYRNKRIS